MEFSSPITVLKGVGEKRASLYRKLGIETVGDLLEHFPRDYYDLTGPLTIAAASETEPTAIRASVTYKTPLKRIRNGLQIAKVRVTDMRNDAILTFFNARYTLDSLEIGKEYVFFGEFTRRTNGDGEMMTPIVFPARESGFLPQYPLTEGLSGKMVSTQMREALSGVGGKIPETLPERIMEKYGLCDRKTAIYAIHFPKDAEDLSKAKRRLIFEEFLAFSLGIMLTKEKPTAVGITFKKTDWREFTETFGFPLTGAQKRVITECEENMSTGHPMNRLIQGDVGSGKTAVAAACMYIAAKNGYQSALMAPTEVLAAQHQKSLERLFAPFGIRVGLLTGSMKAKEKSEIKQALALGQYDIIVGTHAIIQEDVSFRDLGLVITDEQHRFGVRQRMALKNKGQAPHTVVMSATPIPRTLAFVLYGDMDISVLDEMPKNRLPIKTYLIGPELSQRALAFVRKFAEEGKQSYIICPLVEQGEESLPLEAAADLAERLTGEELIGCNVGLLHGRMKSAEKERVMEAFAENRIQVLVSTTVVEVGVDVPGAVCMIIENADRFGLSQLHQLRGRVGRGSEQGYCILITDSHSRETRERLSVIKNSTDGFKIAEEDLRLRGPGDFFGFRQSGLPMMKMANLMTDTGLLELSRKASDELLAEDPALKAPENAALAAEVQKLMEESEI